LHTSCGQDCEQAHGAHPKQLIYKILFTLSKFLAVKSMKLSKNLHISRFAGFVVKKRTAARFCTSSVDKIVRNAAGAGSSP
jgi:hypothetical protein